MRGASFCDAVVHRCSDGRFHASRLLLATLSTTCTDAAEDSEQARVEIRRVKGR